MRRRHLGQSSLEVSALSYGNWLTHGARLDLGEARDCVEAALDVGITTFDTADEYAGGAAERLLGAALAGLSRQSVQICTKVFFPTGSSPDDRGLSRTHIEAGCEGSLRRLGTDYIDLYQAHRYDVAVPIEETMLAFAQLVRQGKVRCVGVSEWTAEQIAAAIRLARELGLPLVSDQAQYSLLWRVPEAEVVPMCAAAGMGLMAYSPLAQGVLTGKYRPAAPPPRRSRAAGATPDDSVHRYLSDELLVVVGRLRAMVERAGHSMAQFALAWVLARPNVATAIIGASRPEQIRHNAQALEVQLDSQLLAAADLTLGDLVERDPAKSGRGYDLMPRWRREPPPSRQVT